MELLTIKLAQLISALFEKLGIFEATPQWLIWALIITCYIVGFIIFFILITSAVIMITKYIIDRVKLRKGKKWKMQLYHELNNPKNLRPMIKKANTNLNNNTKDNFEDRFDDLFES